LLTSTGVQAVIFDWGGTLTPWHALDALDCWLATVGDPGLARRLHEAELVAWARCVEEHRSTTLAGLFEAAGVTATEQMVADFFAWWEPHTLIDPEAKPVLRALRRRGLRIGVLSNTLWPRAEHERIFRRDDVLGLIDAAVYTSEIAWTKPHPEAFAAALAAVGCVDPAEAVFVGDRPFDDIHGAKQAGLHAVLLATSDIPAHQRGGTAGIPDAVIHRLSELPEVIERLAARDTATAAPDPAGRASGVRTPDQAQERDR
jgi:putative hydrolase of the HAD superfamily